MSKQTRKRIWPVSLVMALAIIGMMAVVVLSTNPGTAQAQDGLCDTATGDVLQGLIDAGVCQDDSGGDDEGLCDTATGDVLQGLIDAGVCQDDSGSGGDMIRSDSTSGGAAPELKVVIDSLPAGGLAVGSSIVLYLEDDYQEPATIPASSVYFVASPASAPTGNGARVYTTIAPKIATGAYFDEDKKDISVRVFIPDMCTSSTDDCQGPNGVDANQTLTMVIEDDSGIKNPTEAGTHSVLIDILGPADSIPSASDTLARNDALRATDPSTEQTLMTLAKISLSDVDNKRGYELTITGSGFNDGTTASAYVLQAASAPADCAVIVADPASTLIGSGLVGSDDKVTITAEVTVPTFGAGNVNQICMVDGENRYSSDIDDFKLQPSIRVVPSSVSSGDTVNVFAQDYPAGGGGFMELKLAGQVVNSTSATVNAVAVRATSLTDGAATATFDVPGSVGGKPLQGTVRVDAKWGDTNESTKITVAGSELATSVSDVLPNESITISGNGYGSQTCIDVADITLDNVAVQVDFESTIRCTIGTGDLAITFNGVEVSNSGQFVATITLWPSSDKSTNPTLIPGSHELTVEDSQGFIGLTKLTIAEPTISVLPEVVGPRDYVVIGGENWPVDNTDNSNSGLITIEVSEGGRTRSYSVYADNTGRFSIEHRVSKDVAIPSTNQVKGDYGEGEIVEVANFTVPSATVTVTPGAAQPGDMVSLSATDMPVYASADYVKIGGTVFSDPGANTDIDGNITIEGILVPGLDPGTYSVVIDIDGTVAIGEVEVLAEDSAAGAGAELPGALEGLGDNLLRVFHFNGVNKSWDFFDPRDEFAEFNTLTTMVNGEPYWVLVSEGQEDVVLNNRARTLTCVGGDCWNQIVW